MRKLFYFASFLTLCGVLSASIASAAPTITRNPSPATVCNGTTAMFTTASPDTSVVYVWEVFDGTIWRFVTDGAVYSGATTDTLRVNATSSMTGWFYRVAAMNGTGTSAVTPFVTLTVQSPIVPFSISGSSAVCGSGVTYSSGTTATGAWSVITGDASVTSSGMASAVRTGRDTLVFTASNACNTRADSFAVSTGIGLSISGANTMCRSGFITLSASEAGGTWSASNTNASISSTGAVTGASAGLDTIMYMRAGACPDTAEHVLTLEAPLTIGSITGATTACIGTTTTLTAPVGGGIWLASNTYATIGRTSGVVSGAVRGADTITYSKTNTCGTANSAPFVITVDSSVVHATLTGTSPICATSGTTTIVASVNGGTWSATNANATVSTAGLVNAVAAGRDTIRYINSNACSADTSTFIILIQAPLSGAITGPSTICIGSPMALTAPVSGGNWSASNGNATIDSTSGVVTGATRGRDTMTYSATNSCGTFAPTFYVTIDTAVGHSTISGTASICSTTPATYTGSIAGGTWSVSNALATISASGVLTGITFGMDTVKYTISNGCSSDVAIFPVSVVTPVTSGTLSGSAGVCVGSTITMSSTVTGGRWSVSNGNATIDSMTGVMAGIRRGADTVTYTDSNICGRSSATRVVMVDTVLAHATISGGTRLCIATSVTFTASSAGGAWSVSNTHASITSAGVLTGASRGLDTVMYISSNTCDADTASQVDTVEVPATTGTVTGPSSVCTGSAISVSSSLSGGIWSLTNGNATITSIGIISGVTAGLDTVVYTLMNSCGTSTATYPITINTVTHSTLAGSSTVCVSSSITISPTYSGGSWSATNGHATVSSAGSVTGVSAGVDTIIYTNVGPCNTDVQMKVVRIETPLSPGTVTGATTLCAGSTTSLTTSGTGGAWSSSMTTVAVVDAAGVVTGRGVGTTVISYSVSNSCGTYAATDTITVFRTASVITGTDSVGIGASTTYFDSAAGGSWSIADTTVARIGSTGIVTGRDTGSTTITYMVTNVCGTSWVVKTIFVGPAPSAGAIFGADSVCAGSSITLGDTLAPGGVWRVSNAYGTITSSGIFTGITGGTRDTVFYTFTNGFGSTTIEKYIKIANAPPLVRVWCDDSLTLSISTSSHLLKSSPPGGTFVSTRPSAVTFTTSTGYFVVLHGGTTHLIYTYTNACGTAIDTFTVKLPSDGSDGIDGYNKGASLLNVFPNPNSGTFSLNLLSSFNEEAHITVTNMVGATVKEFDITTNKDNEIGLGQPAGLYMITAVTSHGKHVVKLTVSE